MWSIKEHAVNAAAWAFIGDYLLNQSPLAGFGNRRVALGASALLISYGSDFVAPMIPM